MPVERMTRVTSEVGAQYVGLNLPKPWQEIAKGPVLSCITKHPRTPPPTAFVTRENSKIILFGTPFFRRTHCCSELGLFEVARYFNLFLFYFRMEIFTIWKYYFSIFDNSHDFVKFIPFLLVICNFLSTIISSFAKISFYLYTLLVIIE